ncbi:MAG TPA: single-stranded DNA-binding protein, partial [Candidatus Binatia bacterium]
KVVLLGRLTRDPDLRYTGAGLAVCEFPLATHHHYRVNEEAREEICYVDIVVFGKPAEAGKEYLKKGSRVLIDGRLVQRRWETPEGKTRSKHEVVANSIQFIDTGPPSEPGKSSAEGVPF